MGVIVDVTACLLAALAIFLCDRQLGAKDQEIQRLTRLLISKNQERILVQERATEPPPNYKLKGGERPKTPKIPID